MAEDTGDPKITAVTILFAGIDHRGVASQLDYVYSMVYCLGLELYELKSNWLAGVLPGVFNVVYSRQHYSELLNT